MAYWASRLERRVNSISEVILRFLDSPEFGRTMAPVARLALTVLQDTPEYADLQSWSASSRGGTPLADIAREAMGKPVYPSRAQLAALRRAAQLAPLRITR